MGEQLDIYIDSLSDTRLIFNGLIEDVDTATDAVSKLDDAVDDIQDIANDAEKLRNLADNLGDFVSLLKLFPPTRFIADKVTDIIRTIENRIEDIEDKTEEVEDILKKYDTGLTVLKNSLKALKLDLQNDAADIDAAFASVEELQTSLNATQINQPSELNVTLDELEAQLETLNAQFPQAQVDQAIAAANAVAEALSQYDSISGIINTLQSSISEAISQVEFLVDPLETVADALSPLTWLLEKAEDVIDAVSSVTIDPILDALGVSRLLDSVTGAFTGLLPEVFIFTPLNNLETDLVEVFGEEIPDNTWELPLKAEYDAFIGEILGENGYLESLFADGTAGADLLAGRNNALSTEDLLAGLGGNDVLTGGPGDDTLGGGFGDDIIVGGAGNDSVDGGGNLLGDDVDVFHVSGTFGEYSFTADSGVLELTHVTPVGESTGVDRIVRTEWISFAGVFIPTAQLLAATTVNYNVSNEVLGTAGNDLLIGGTKADVIKGFEGSDNILGLWGADPGAVQDTIDGGDDTIDGFVDTVQYTAINPLGTGAFALLDLSLTDLLDQRTDVLLNIENVIGSLESDTIIGDDVENGLSGGAGGDIIAAGAGTDTIDGGDDQDTLFGGDGDDSIIIKPDGAHDRVVASRGADRYTGQPDFGDVILYSMGASDLLGANVAENVMAALTPFVPTLASSLPDRIVLTPTANGYAVEKFYGGVSETDTIDTIGSLVATSGDDDLTLRKEWSLIDAGAGDDLITGYTPDRDAIEVPANHLVYGGDGNDTLVSASADENFVGGEGDDWFVITSDLADDTRPDETSYTRVFYGGNGPVADPDDPLQTPQGAPNEPWGFEYDLNSQFDPIPAGGTDAGWDTMDFSQSDLYIRMLFERSLVVGRESNDGTTNQLIYRFSDVDRFVGSEAGNGVFYGGTARNYEIVGGGGNDLVFGRSDGQGIGRDSVIAWGNDGDDDMFGWLGVEEFYGGDGDDFLMDDGNLEGATETLHGGAGDDFISMGREGFRGGELDMDGGEGRDTARFRFDEFFLNPDSITVNLATEIYTFGTTVGSMQNFENASVSVANASVFGTDEANAVTVAQGNNSVSVGAGNDVVFGGSDNDTIFGGTGNDLINPGEGGGFVDGGEDYDQLWFHSGMTYDRLTQRAWSIGFRKDEGFGRQLDDGIVMVIADGIAQTANGDLVFQNFEEYAGSTGNDSIVADPAGSKIDGWWGDDSLEGGAGNDTLNGGANADVIRGHGGDDEIIVGSAYRGKDIADGGDGFDTLFFDPQARNLVVKNGSADGVVFEDYGDSFFQDGIEIFVEREDDVDVTFQNFERVVLSENNDVMWGENADEEIAGLNGNDTLQGRGGADTIIGGDGDDLIMGSGATGAEPRDLPRMTFMNQGNNRNDYIIATNTPMPTTAMTVEMMVNGEQLDRSQAIFSYGVTGSTNEWTLFALSTGTLQILVNGTAYNTPVQNTLFLDGTDRRLSVTWEDDGYMQVFVDGARVWNDRITIENIDAPITSGGAVVLGQDQDGGTPGVASSFQDTQAFSGGISDLRIFNAVISDKLIAERAEGLLDNPLRAPSLLHNSTSMDGFNDFLTFKGDTFAEVGNITYQSRTLQFTPDGDDSLVGGLGSDEIYGNLGNDTLDGGEGNDLLVGDYGRAPIPLYFINEKLNFSGGFIDANFGVMPSSAFTFEVMLEALPSEPGGYSLLSYAVGDAGSDNEISIFIDTNEGDLDVSLKNSAYFEISDVDIGKLMNGAPHMLSVTWDGTTGEVAVFIDGELEFRGLGPSAFQTTIDNDGSLVLGQDQDSRAGDFDERQAFRGGLGEVRIFDTVQSDQDIAARAGIALGGNAGTTSNLIAYYTAVEGEDALIDQLQTPGLEDLIRTGLVRYTSGDDRGVDGDDTLNGGEGNDTMEGGGGADLLYGGADADLGFGGDGADTLDGGTGADTLLGEDGNDTLLGDTGSDRLEGGLDNDSLDGGDDNDELFGGGTGADTLLGGRGSDFLFGENGNDYMEGGDGFDLLNGGADDDTLMGGNGNDRLFGNLGNDSLEGEAGNDTLFGGPSGNDILKGGDDDDQLFGETGRDILFGEGGDDTLLGGLNDDTLLGGEGDDSIEGGQGNDQLFGGPTGADTLKGGQGSDFLFAESSDDLLEGGDGFDLMNGGAGNDLMLGGNGGDRLEGNLGEDTLDGGAGDDELFGGNGAFDDTLIGGAGNDSLRGEAGSDSFVFEDGFGNDTIYDFNAFDAAEKIDLVAVTAISDYADLTANHMQDVGVDVVITDGSNTITILNAQEADLGSDDFVFV